MTQDEGNKSGVGRLLRKLASMDPGASDAELNEKLASREGRLNFACMSEDEIEALPIGALIQSDRGKFMVVTGHYFMVDLLPAWAKAPNMMHVIQMGEITGQPPDFFQRTMRASISPSTFRLRRVA